MNRPICTTTSINKYDTFSDVRLLVFCIQHTTMEEMDSAAAIAGSSTIADFFRDQTVLLTGVTGALGRLILYKLLQSCSCRTIYLVVRAKNGRSEQQRLDRLLAARCFDGLLNAKRAECLERVRLVAGDCFQPRLGIAATQLQEILATTTVIVHSAASIRFNQNLKYVAQTNIRASYELLLLAQQMAQLKVMVYVSTAFSFCSRNDIDEQVYPVESISAQGLLRVVDELGEEQVALLQPSLLQDWPNTYVFTKALAENAIKEYQHLLPLTIVRPAIIFCAFREPKPGFVDNIHGVNGISLATYLGLLRVQQCDEKCRIEIVPADFVVNLILASAYHRSQQPVGVLPVYNYVCSPQRPLTTGQYRYLTAPVGQQYPSMKSVFPQMSFMFKGRLQFELALFLLHTLPAHIFDILMRLCNKPAKAVSFYRMLNDSVRTVGYFTTHQWNFENANVCALWKSLSPVDQKLFPFDMEAVQWVSFLHMFSHNIRLYMTDDTADNIPDAKRRQKKLQIMMYMILALVAFVVLLPFVVIYKIFFAY